MAGRLSAIHLDEGTASTTAPTNNSKLIRSYAYNAYGEIEKITDNTSFLTGGTLTTELAYTYNDFGLPVKLTYTDVDGETRTVREETNLTYDGNGNILTEAVTEAYSGSTTKTRTYQYDLGNRLISAAYDGTTTTYTYDAAGNRLTRQEGTETAETYTYNYLNQLTRVQQGTAVTTYTYDARGNQTQQVQTGTGVTTTTNYGYDLANRLTSTSISNNAVIPLSTSATYAYNAQGQRVTRVEDEVITHFYYTGSALLFTTVNEYVLQTQNILDPSGTIVASKRFEGQAETEQDPYADDYFFYRYDIRGSVTNIVDGEGAVVKSYDYDEFGVTTASGEAFCCRHLFQIHSIIGCSAVEMTYAERRGGLREREGHCKGRAVGGRRRSGVDMRLHGVAVAQQLGDGDVAGGRRRIPCAVDCTVPCGGGVRPVPPCPGERKHEDRGCPSGRAVCV